MEIATPRRKAEDKALAKSRELSVNIFVLKSNEDDTSMFVGETCVLPKIGYPFEDLFAHYTLTIERIYKEQCKSERRAEIQEGGALLICQFKAWVSGYMKYTLDKRSHTIEVEWDDGYKT